jgi:hypothetical protein
LRLLRLGRLHEHVDHLRGRGRRLCRQHHRPGPNIVILVLEEVSQVSRGEPTNSMQSPQRPEFPGDIVGGLQVRSGGLDRVFSQRPGRRTFLENAPGLPDVPVVRVNLEFEQFGVREFGDISGPPFRCVRKRP